MFDFKFFSLLIDLIVYYTYSKIFKLTRIVNPSFFNFRTFGACEMLQKNMTVILIKYESVMCEKKSR